MQIETRLLRRRRRKAEIACRAATIGGSFSQPGTTTATSTFRSTTLRWRIGDRVVIERPGSFEGEDVQLSQITATVDDLDEVDKTADIIKSLLEKYHKQSTTT